jgi:hypothetical protein
MIVEFVEALNRSDLVRNERQYEKLIVAYALFCMACTKESAYRYPFSLRRVKELCEEAGLDLSDQPRFRMPMEALDWFEDKLWQHVLNGQKAEHNAQVQS